MAIKRGVSFYSYQQTQFFGQMNWKDMIREVHDNLKCDGVEIIDESTIPHYPFPSEEFIYDWNSEMARYDMKATTKDIYLDTLQFRDHVITYGEAAERLKYDIILAAKMGFQNVRCLCMVPIEIIDRALETAVKYNVRIGKEIHAPYPIKRDPNREGGIMVTELLEYVDKKGCKDYVGLVPDMGIFQHSQSRIAIEHAKRTMGNPDAIDDIVEKQKTFSRDDLARYINETYPQLVAQNPMFARMFAMKQAADPQDILEIIPYILSIHGKFYEMTEIPGEPGHFEDAAIDYAGPFKYLLEGGFDGYINSEYEGQRSQQDRGIEFLPNEVKEVRRQHEMMARLSGEKVEWDTSLF